MSFDGFDNPINMTFDQSDMHIPQDDRQESILQPQQSLLDENPAGFDYEETRLDAGAEDASLNLGARRKSQLQTLFEFDDNEEEADVSTFKDPLKQHSLQAVRVLQQHLQGPSSKSSLSFLSLTKNVMETTFLAIFICDVGLWNGCYLAMPFVPSI